MDSTRLPGRGKGMKQPQTEYVGTFIKATGTGKVYLKGDLRVITQNQNLGHVVVEP